ncbi:Hypothetical protein CINCED_3A020695 [Cinara cedri]|uniref:Uncharacterized protein n=1 Tax=Cinara cedri TaxID=506608 RepID=A0A5E4MLD3_9HEMI|nr:Hypothetical protein CINCED_3A020695 [Cinara cedri]
MEYKQEVRNKDFYLKKGRRTEKFDHYEKRKEFREYLYRTGTLDRLTEIMMDFYENPVLNWPSLEYLRTKLVAHNPDAEEIKKLRPKLEEVKSYRDYLVEENARLKEIFKTSNYTLSEDTSAHTDV